MISFTAEIGEQPKQAPGVDGNASSGWPLERAPRILLADDDHQVRRLISRVLSMQGWEVKAVPDGRDVIALCASGKHRFDLLVLDIKMQCIGGYEAYKQIRDMCPDTKVLFVSGYTDTDTGGQIVAQGLAWLHKPFSPNELVAKVLALLNAGPTCC